MCLSLSRPLKRDPLLRILKRVRPRHVQRRPRQLLEAEFYDKDKEDAQNPFHFLQMASTAMLGETQPTGEVSPPHPKSLLGDFALAAATAPPMLALPAPMVPGMRIYSSDEEPEKEHEAYSANQGVQNVQEDLQEQWPEDWQEQWPEDWQEHWPEEDWQGAKVAYVCSGDSRHVLSRASEAPHRCVDPQLYVP